MNDLLWCKGDIGFWKYLLSQKHNHYLLAFSGHVARALSACVIYGVKIAGIKETLSKI